MRCATIGKVGERGREGGTIRRNPYDDGFKIIYKVGNMTNLKIFGKTFLINCQFAS